MADLWTVSEADLPRALAVASYVSRAQRAALDALPQWQGQAQGPSGARMASQQRAAPPVSGPSPWRTAHCGLVCARLTSPLLCRLVLQAADDSPPLQFMNAQDAPAFGDEPLDDAGGGGGGEPFGGGPAMRATPTASPVPALFETQPRGGTAVGQAARDRRVEIASVEAPPSVQCCCVCALR